MDTPGRCILFAVFILSGMFFELVLSAAAECNKIRIKQLAQDKVKRAVCADWLISKYDFLMLSLGICKVASLALALILARLIFGEGNFLVALFLLLPFALVFTSYIPSAFGEAASEGILLFSSYAVFLFSIALSPIVLPFTLLTRLVKSHVLYKKDDYSYSEEEFSEVVEKVEKEGVLEEEESDIINSAFEFGDLTAIDVMTPIDKVRSITMPMDREELLSVLVELKFSRVPIISSDGRKISGILRAGDYVVASVSSEVDVEKYIIPPLYVSPDARLVTIMNEMKKKRRHLAVVRDKERAVIGILTMDDILSELVGESVDGESAGDEE